jgi:antitoxin component of MazEF toxin-antitoxin module
LALRIPKAFALEVGLEKDREVELSVHRGRLVIAPPAAKVTAILPTAKTGSRA